MLLRALPFVLPFSAPLLSSACDTPEALAADMATPYNSHGGLGGVVESQEEMGAGVPVTLLPQDAGNVRDTHTTRTHTDCTFPIADPCAYLYSTPLHSPHKNVSRRLPLPASTAPRTGSTSCRRRLDLDSGPFLSRGAVGATTKSAASAVPRPSSGRLTTSRKRPGAPV